MHCLVEDVVIDRIQSSTMLPLPRYAHYANALELQDSFQTAASERVEDNLTEMRCGNSKLHNEAMLGRLISQCGHWHVYNYRYNACERVYRHFILEQDVQAASVCSDATHRKYTETDKESISTMSPLLLPVKASLTRLQHNQDRLQGTNHQHLSL